jgi:uncharacterized protein YegP (UPF0339 family)
MAIKITGTNTAAAPGITGDDTDTGLVYGTNQVDISTGGSSRVTVDSNGYVGIGTASPAQLLTVKGLSKFEASNSTNGWVSYTHTDNTYRFNYNGAGNDEVILTSDGHLLVARTSAIHGGKLSLDYTGGSSAGMAIKDTQTSVTGVPMQIVNGSGTIVGSITQNQSNAAFNTSSDYRLKENVVAISDGITRIKTLKPSRFNWISDSSNTTIDGFLAHEVTAVPEAVQGTKDAVAIEDNEKGKKGDPIYQQIDQSKLVPLLTAALQEAIAKIETLETKVAALEAHTHE